MGAGNGGPGSVGLIGKGSAKASGKVAVGMQMLAVDGSSLIGQGKEVAISLMKDVSGSARIAFVDNQGGYVAMQAFKEKQTVPIRAAFPFFVGCRPSHSSAARPIYW